MCFLKIFSIGTEDSNGAPSPILLVVSGKGLLSDFSLTNRVLLCDEDGVWVRALPVFLSGEVELVKWRGDLGAVGSGILNERLFGLSEFNLGMSLGWG